MELIARNTPLDWWVALGLLLAVLVLASTRWRSNKNFIISLKAFFDSRYFRQTSREDYNVFGRTSLGLFFLALINYSLILYYPVLKASDGGISVFFGISGGVLLFSATKYVFQIWLGNVFELPSIRFEAKFLSVFFIHISGLFLTPCVLLAYLLPDSMNVSFGWFSVLDGRVGLALAFVVLLVLYVYKLFMASMQSKAIKVSWYYIIAYLCTLEMVPLIVVYQLLVGKF